jgi:helix-turn-helix protein
MRCHRREKVFGPGRAVPLDRNAKCRIQAYARAWSARNRQPRQHRGPITRAFLEVLKALLWGFHNAHTGVCFPSYETIAAKAECNRDTVYEALKVLEWAGVLTWQNRITRILVRERDLFGQWASRWRVIRTSNAYVFRDPLQGSEGVPASESENPSGTGNQDILDLVPAPPRDPNSPLERALTRFGAALGAKNCIEQENGPIGASM